MPAALDPTGAPADWLRPFSMLLARPTWRRAPVLMTGAVLASGRRTVAAVLRVDGCDWALGVAQYHRVLNRARWSRLAVARVLLELLAGAFRRGLS